MKYRNSEGYPDPTAGTAIAHIAYEERQQRLLERKKRRSTTRMAKRSSTHNPHTTWIQAWPPTNGKVNRLIGGK